jgi:hypothetical protein
MSGSRSCLRYHGGTRLDGRRVENSSPARDRVGNVDVAEAYRTAPTRRSSRHAARATRRRLSGEPRQPRLQRCYLPRARPIDGSRSPVDRGAQVGLPLDLSAWVAGFELPARVGPHHDVASESYQCLWPAMLKLARARWIDGATYRSGPTGRPTSVDPHADSGAQWRWVLDSPHVLTIVPTAVGRRREPIADIQDNDYVPTVLAGPPGTDNVRSSAWPS